MRLRENRWLVVLAMVLVYLLSRALFSWMGVSFDESPLTRSWQNLDVVALQHDLLAGVHHQHAQPPLFNLFLGVVLKLFPVAHAAAFSLVFRALGLAAYLLSYAILTRLGFGRKIAFLAATLFILTPTAVLYESWLFYTWPIAVLLALAAYLLLLHEETLEVRYAVGFLVVIALLCLTRSMFHVVFLVACAAGVLLVRSPGRRRILAFAVGLLLVVGALPLKNYLVFGSAQTSSWLGMNLWKMVGHNVAGADLPMDAGVGAVPAFSPIDRYPERYREVPARFSSVPVLREERKSTGEPNLNHHGYLAVSREYLKGARHLIAADPGAYLRSVGKGWGYYCRPAWDYWFLQDNRERLQPYIDLVSLAPIRFLLEELFLGEDAAAGAFPRSSYLLVPGMLILVVVNLVLGLVRRFRGGSRPRSIVFLAFLVLTVLYVALLGNALEYGENNRFRVQTDLLLYLAVIVSLRDLGGALRQRVFEKRDP
ncbi:MAG: glycosyltransferase family 39 protein [Deltaproteobacteria bacterium]|nr:glycosyltransferase family 39 protein [Deltaproteobacteria bacterium]